MFLEWWMIGILGLLYVVALMSTSRDAGIDGFTKGVNHGAEMCLKILEMKGIIEIEEGGEIRGLDKKV